MTILGHFSLSTPTTSLSHYTHFFEFPQTNLKIRQSTFSSFHHSHLFSSPYLFIFIPFLFICACYNMLYLFCLPRNPFSSLPLRLSYSLHIINLIFSSDTAFLLHSFFLIIPKCTAFSCTHLSSSTPTTSLAYYTHFIEFPQTNLEIRLPILSSFHHSHPFSSPYLFIFIPFIFIYVCYSMLYLFCLPRYSFFPRSL